MAHALSVYVDQRVGGLTLRCPLLFQLPGFDPNAISVVGKHIGKRNFPHGIRHGFGHWSIRIFENVVDIPSHGACVIPSLVDADHIIEVRGFHCLMDIEQSDFLGGVGKFGAAGSACHSDEPRAFERSQGVTNADGVRPGAFGEQRAGRRSLFRLSHRELC